MAAGDGVRARVHDPLLHRRQHRRATHIAVVADRHRHALRHGRADRDGFDPAVPRALAEAHGRRGRADQVLAVGLLAETHVAEGAALRQGAVAPDPPAVGSVEGVAQSSARRV